LFVARQVLLDVIPPVCIRNSVFRLDLSSQDRGKPFGVDVHIPHAPKVAVLTKAPWTTQKADFALDEPEVPIAKIAGVSCNADWARALEREDARDKFCTSGGFEGTRCGAEDLEAEGGLQGVGELDLPLSAGLGVDMPTNLPRRRGGNG
jgi:hypothetical protein